MRNRFRGIAFALLRDQVAMKSCRCANCNVSSARYTWGFALLARDGWQRSAPQGVAADEEEGAWLCRACIGSADTQPDTSSSVKPQPRSRARPRGILRVLLVDDEEMVRRCTARQLAELEVVCAASALEALDLLARDSDFDAVLSDVMMPRVSGPELYARCHESYPLLAQRFVFASGNPEAARIELRCVAQRLGEDFIPILLPKPSTREALLLALFAAAATTSARSGVYSVALAEPEVKTYRG